MFKQGQGSSYFIIHDNKFFSNIWLIEYFGFNKEKLAFKKSSKYHLGAKNCWQMKESELTVQGKNCQTNR